MTPSSSFPQISLKGREGRRGKTLAQLQSCSQINGELGFGLSHPSFPALRLTEYKYCMMPQSCPSKWLQDASFPPNLEQGKYCGLEAPGGERLEKLLVPVPDVSSKVLLETKTWRRNFPTRTKKTLCFWHGQDKLQLVFFCFFFP